MSSMQPSALAMARAHRHIADIGRPAFRKRDNLEGVVVRPDAFDGTFFRRTEARAWPVGDAQIHRHADESDLQAGEIGRVGGVGPIGRVEQAGEAAVRRLAPVGAVEPYGHGLGEPGIGDLGALGPGKGGAQGLQLFLVEHL